MLKTLQTFLLLILAIGIISLAFIMGAAVLLAALIAIPIIRFIYLYRKKKSADREENVNVIDVEYEIINEKQSNSDDT